MMHKEKKLYRHTDEKRRVFAGILSGLAEYFDVDVTMLRIVFVLFVLSTGFFPGVFGYIVAIFLIPPRGGGHTATEDGSRVYDV